MNFSTNKIEIPNLRIDNYKFSSFANFLFDENFIAKIKDKNESDYFNHLSSYQEALRYLEKESVELPVLLDGFEHEDYILALITKTLSNYKVFQFKEKDKNGYFIKITNTNIEDSIPFNLETNLEKGAYLNICVTQNNHVEIIQSLHEEFSSELFGVIKYFHFLRLQKQVKLSLQTDLTKFLIAKKITAQQINDCKEQEIKLANKLRKIITELNSIISEQFGKYKSGILSKRMRIQSKGILEFGIISEYKIDFNAEDGFLIINNAYEISEKICTDLRSGFIKDSDIRIGQLNQSANRLINQLSQEEKMNEFTPILKNKFLILSSDISTEPLLDKLNYYFNFDEIEIDKRTKLQWPDIKSLLMSVIFTSIFFITSTSSIKPNTSFLEELQYLWENKLGFLALRVSFLFMSIATFLISFYGTNKSFIKAYFKNGIIGIRNFKKNLIKKQIDNLLTRQMSDYVSATNDSINNYLDLLNLKYKKIKEQIIEEAEDDFSLILNYKTTSRSLEENNLAELNILIQTIQSKLN